MGAVEEHVQPRSAAEVDEYAPEWGWTTDVGAAQRIDEELADQVAAIEKGVVSERLTERQAVESQEGDGGVLPARARQRFHAHSTRQALAGRAGADRSTQAPADIDHADLPRWSHGRALRLYQDAGAHQGEIHLDGHGAGRPALLRLV
ncbi:hypothetical protein VYU27_000679 [Nannochloropsis oceanica]